jgi:uncharacterized OsmC-like protein
MKVTSVWDGGYKSVLSNGRGHTAVVDMPIEQNGTNTAPTALELAVMSLAGCITTIFKMMADKRKFVYKAFKVELDAEKPKDALTVTALKGRMELVTEAEETEARTVLRLTLGSCPVGEIFDKAGLKLDYVLTVKKP